MANSSFVKPEVLTENKITINSFLKESSTQVKKQVQDRMTYINESVSRFKKEFSFMYDRTGDYLDRITLPVNNFLKDLAQIDSEFHQEQSKETGQFICMEGKMIPVEDVLCQQMEENY